jgi:transcriptional regulator NrdR family protein
MKHCPECKATLLTIDSRPQTPDTGSPYTVRRKQCSVCAKRFTTHEVWVEELRKNDDGYIPLDRREEYKFLMRKLKGTKAEVLEIMGIKNAAQKGQVQQDG